MAPGWLEILTALAQYAAAAFVFGLPFFRLHNGDRLSDSDLTLLTLAAVWLLAWTVLASALFAAGLYESWDDALNPADLWFALTGITAGWGYLARACLVVIFALIVQCVPARYYYLRTWALAGAGALVMASFAWTGHGTSTPGPPGFVHLGATILHLLAAAVWLGALLVLLAGLMGSTMGTLAGRAAVHLQLARFSGMGTLAVVLILVPGIVNAAFLVGVDGAGALLVDAYGHWLLTKFALFTLMLSLAGLNRFVLTPRLARDLAQGNSPAGVIIALRASIGLEILLGGWVLLAAAAMGRMAPIAG